MQNVTLGQCECTTIKLDDVDDVDDVDKKYSYIRLNSAAPLGPIRCEVEFLSC